MNDRWEAGYRGRDRGRDRGSLAMGALLILVGAVFFAAQVLNVNWGTWGWPLYVIVPGLALLTLGFLIGGDGGLGAAIPGGIVTAVGLLLAFQNATGDYASWSYAWALVAPGSIGVTLFLYGALHRRGDLVDSGLRTAAVGLGLFVGFGLFFENLLRVSEGTSSSALRDAMPFLAVILGVLIVLINLLPGQRRRPTEGSWGPNSGHWTGGVGQGAAGPAQDAAGPAQDAAGPAQSAAAAGGAELAQPTSESAGSPPSPPQE